MKTKCTDTTEFIYMGDPQCSRITGIDNDYSRWGRVLKAVRGCRENADGRKLLVLGGDVVNRGDKEEEWQSFLNELEKEGRGLQVVTPVTGSEASVGRHSSFFYNSSNGPKGYEKNFFSFDYGCIHFLVLDSEYMGKQERRAYKYIGDWIKRDLAANDRPASIVVMHQPMVTVGLSFEDDVRATIMRKNFMGLFQKYGVDFILCGHQHVYCRSKEIADDKYRGGITQLMAVSGGKYFEATTIEDMEVCFEFISTGTAFACDGNTISLETVDEEGNVLDKYSKKVRKSAEKKCRSCRNYDRCGGRGIFERNNTEIGAEGTADPLKPENREGIVVKYGETGKKFFDSQKLEELEKVTVTYSIRLKDGLVEETKRGFLLEALLQKAGIKECRKENCAIIITAADGKQKIIKAAEIMESGFFGKETTMEIRGRKSQLTSTAKVPAMLFLEKGEYRLAFGQTDPKQFNGRQWARKIREIEVVEV